MKRATSKSEFKKKTKKNNTKSVKVHEDRTGKVVNKSQPTFRAAVESKVHKFLKSKPYLDYVDLKEKKLPKVQGLVRVSDVVYGAPDVTLASDFVSLNKVYRFRLGGFVDINMTSGVINSWLPCDPSSAGINFPEWTTLSALFSEFRLVEFGAVFNTEFDNHSNVIGTSTTGLPNCLIAGNLGTAGAPGSYATLADNADSMLVNFSHMTTATGYKHAIDGRGVGWSQVTTPTTTPYAGAPGSIQIYGSFGSVTQGNTLKALVWGIYDFRSRV